MKNKIKYIPTLSVKELAELNNCSEALIRKHIKIHGIDRASERTNKTINALRKIYSESKSPRDLANESEYSLNTIKKYWSFIIGETEPSKVDTKKVSKVAIRQKKDYYATHPSVTTDLLKVEAFNNEILEPCCGGGIMAEAIKAGGYSVSASDLVDRNYGTSNVDFLTAEFEEGKFDIITNPPYKLCTEIIKKALKVAKNKVALLLPLRYLSSEERANVYAQYPPKYVYVYTNRICIAKNGEFEKYKAGQNLEIYAWYVWYKGFEGETTLRWITNKSE